MIKNLLVRFIALYSVINSVVKVHETYMKRTYKHQTESKTDLSTVDGAIYIHLHSL